MPTAVLANTWVMLGSGKPPKVKIHLELLVSVDFLQINLLKGFFPVAPLSRRLLKFRIQAENWQMNVDEVLSFSCTPGILPWLSLLTPGHPSLTTSRVKSKSSITKLLQRELSPTQWEPMRTGNLVASFLPGDHGLYS